MALKRGIVELAEYNSNWKKEYEKEEKLLKEVLGDRIIEIHHIGSTSIEGLKAKPVIDILVVINSLDEITEIMTKVALKQINAPCIVYNLNGYYDSLKVLLDHMIEMGLSTSDKQEKIYFANNLSEIDGILTDANE